MPPGRFCPNKHSTNVNKTKEPVFHQIFLIQPIDLLFYRSQQENINRQLKLRIQPAVATAGCKAAFNFASLANRMLLRYAQITAAAE
ncbi:MAG: hypothetical protein IKK75_08990 [Clostridia bacterium]|nr:hypothetical protein [Clostridia bacterium]